MSTNVVGRRIRLARTMHNPPLEQKDLMAKLQVEGLNISQPTLSNIENEKRIVSDIELKVFAKVLGVSVNWLLGETDSFIK
mgnify:CR=1 FL=1